MPNYAAAQQVPKDDERLKTGYETVPSPQGNGSIKGYLARPASACGASCRAFSSIHENRGLNPHIEDVARRFALENFMAFAPDGLTSVGGYPGDDDKGGELFANGRSREDDRGLSGGREVAESAPRLHRQDRRDRLLLRRRRRQHAGRADGRRHRRRGAVLRSAPAAADVPKIKAAVLVHHGELDTRLAEAWPAYEMALEGRRGHRTKGTSIPAPVHGFNNDATPERYNKAAADQAWKRTIEWFNKYVRG